MGDISIALLATFSIYILITLIKLTRSFIVYKKVKKTIIYSIYYYFNQYDYDYANLEALKKLIEKKLKHINSLEKIEFLELKWKKKNTFQLRFKLNAKKSYPVHSFSFDVSKIRKTLDYNNSEV
jgi:hypothetical protein